MKFRTYAIAILAGSATAITVGCASHSDEVSSVTRAPEHPSLASVFASGSAELVGKVFAPKSGESGRWVGATIVAANAKVKVAIGLPAEAPPQTPGTFMSINIHGFGANLGANTTRNAQEFEPVESSAFGAALDRGDRYVAFCDDYVAQSEPVPMTVSVAGSSVSWSGKGLLVFKNGERPAPGTIFTKDSFTNDGNAPGCMDNPDVPWWAVGCKFNPADNGCTVNWVCESGSQKGETVGVPGQNCDVYRPSWNIFLYACKCTNPTNASIQAACNPAAPIVPAPVAQPAPVQPPAPPAPPGGN
jgi:hypothetical protein